MAVSTTMGTAYLPRHVDYPQEEITFDLTKLLWMTKIDVQGVHRVIL